ncbi:MAG: hypothetical protein C4519_24370 [Desulfobacteraceae bacterium]|nr:MAG: hypothetical protein C4519_24370 [Desulfobacteraceae bacterium]
MITKEDFKSHRIINTNDDDEIIDILIDAVEEFIKSYVGRVIEKETITEYFDGDDLADTIFLANYPVVALTSLQYNRGTYSDPDWQDINADYYQLDDDIGEILIDVMYSGRRNIKAVYEAGYVEDDIPKSLKAAALKLVTKLYDKRSSEGFSIEEVAGARIEWGKFLSDDVKALLAANIKPKL